MTKENKNRNGLGPSVFDRDTSKLIVLAGSLIFTFLFTVSIIAYLKLRGML